MYCCLCGEHKASLVETDSDDVDADTQNGKRLFNIATIISHASRSILESPMCGGIPWGTNPLHASWFMATQRPISQHGNVFMSLGPCRTSWSLLNMWNFVPHQFRESYSFTIPGADAAIPNQWTPKGSSSIKIYLHAGRISSITVWGLLYVFKLSVGHVASAQECTPLLR